jgi:molecular chaperone GrpE (heat shock protein)
MTSTATWKQRVASAWVALIAPRADPADPQARNAVLELDLQQRDAEIDRLRAEYRRLADQAEQARAGAATAGFETLARRLAPLLSQLATMQALAANGRDVRAPDVLTLFGKLDAMLADGVGLSRIGTVGEQAGFDTRLHQLLSGMDVDDGDPVTVRFVGYRLGESILTKAMVSAGADKAHAGT